MPMIADQPPVQVVWEMPFVTAALSSFAMSGFPATYSEGSKKTVLEGIQAIRRFKDNIFDDIGAITPPHFNLLNPLTSQDDLRAFAMDHAIDFDDLVAHASHHFVSATIYRQQHPLSENELESMFEDDQRAFDR